MHLGVFGILGQMISLPFYALVINKKSTALAGHE